MSLFFANHGRTELCAAGIILPDHLDLSMDGMGDAVAIGRKLNQQLNGAPLDYIIAAPTVRAHSTAELAAGMVAFPGEIVMDNRLAPRRVPERLIGRLHSEVPYDNPAELDALGVEPTRSMRERTDDLLVELAGFAGSALLIGDNKTLELFRQTIHQLPPYGNGLPNGTVLNIGRLQLV